MPGRLGDRALLNSEIQQRYSDKMRRDGNVRISGYIKDPELIRLFREYQEETEITSVQGAIYNIIREFLTESGS